MNRPKAQKAWGKDVPVEEPGMLRDVFRLLRETQREFPIKVEGTSTLPYTSVVKDVDFEKGRVKLKLVRPLPHELLEGAEFRATLALEDQRFEALVEFKGREEYLTYAFTLPPNLFYADRRQEKRYPFRPRESAYVMAQDGGIPGYGVAGPLLNISMGGLAMRVDRVIKLDDGMRVPAGSAPFERGKSFSRIRIQDLPKLPILELSGLVTHYSEGGSGMLLGFAWSQFTETHRSALKECFALRDQVFRKSPGGIREALQALPRAGAPALDGIRGEAPRRSALEPDLPRPALPGTDPLERLVRRATRLALAVSTPEFQERLSGALRAQGFHRLEVLPNLSEAGALWRAATPPAALLVDVALGGGRDEAAAVRLLERQLQAFGDIPLVVLAEQVEDAALMNLGPRTRLLSLGGGGEDEQAAWGSAIAYAAGLLE